MDVPSDIPAGEAFVASFAGMTRSMVAQSRALARKVSLAQLLDDANTTNDYGNNNNNNSDNKENRGRKNEINTVDGSERSPGQHGAGRIVTLVAGNNNTSTSNNREKVLENLRSLDAIVADLERRSAAVREAIDREQRGNEAIQEMTEMTKRLTKELAETCDALPEHLPNAVPPPSAANSVKSGVNTVSEGGVAPVSGTAAAARASRSGLPPAAAAEFEEGGKASRVVMSASPVVLELELVTVGELAAVPRSTRARLTIAQVNGAITDIQKAMERRHAFLSKPRKKMSEKQRRRLEELKQQEVPAHAGEPFIAEADLRALPTFKKGEVTAKALIATLRSLKRLKGVRAAGTMTYVVQGG